MLGRFPVAIFNWSGGEEARRNLSIRRVVGLQDGNVPGASSGPSCDEHSADTAGWFVALSVPTQRRSHDSWAVSHERGIDEKMDDG